MLTPKQCKICGMKFTPSSGNGKYCSDRCRAIVYGPKPKVLMHCLNCGDEFSTLAHRPQNWCVPCRAGTRFTEDEKLSRCMEALRDLVPDVPASMVELFRQMLDPKQET